MDGRGGDTGALHPRARVARPMCGLTTTPAKEERGRGTMQLVHGAKVYLQQYHMEGLLLTCLLAWIHAVLGTIHRLRKELLGRV